MIQVTPTFKPTCPHHGVPLDGLPFPMPSKGEGICPVSGCHFDYEVELDEVKVSQDKVGNTHKDVSWKVSGND